MKYTNFPKKIASFCLAMILFCLSARAESQLTILSADDLGSIQAARVSSGASLTQVKVAGANRIRFITPTNADHPRFDLIPAGSDLNWSGYATLSFTASSASINDSSPMKIYIEDTSKNSQIFAASLPPGTTEPLAAIFNLQDSLDFGIFHGVGDLSHPKGSPNTRLNLAHISVAFVYFSQTVFSNVYDFGSFTLQPNPKSLSPSDFAYKGLMDRFGQNNLQNWAGKVTSVEDLVDKGKLPECLKIGGSTQCLPLKPSSGFSQYGGIKSKRLNQYPSGYFRVQQDENGRWWFVDPEGYAFFMVGMNGVYIGEAATFTEVPSSPPSPLSGVTNNDIRKSLFSWLPSQSDPVYKAMYSSKAYSSTSEEPTFNFYQSNLYTRYGGALGSDYLERWRQRARERMVAWGFNTVGNSSELPFWGTYKSSDASAAQINFPYTPRIAIGGTYDSLPAWGGTSLPDVFDPRYAVAVSTSIQSGLMKEGGPGNKGKFPHDPWLIGYLIDNELPWGYDDRTKSTTNFITKNLIPILVFGMPANAHAKKTLVAQLINKYQTISAFNSVWGTQFNSFGGIWGTPLSQTELTRLSQSPNLSKIQSDMDQFTRTYAETYYRTIRWQLYKVDPDHLYLCSKFGHKRFTQLIVGIAAKYCDVVSFDIYRRTVDDRFGGEFEFLRHLNKPVMIAEFNSNGLEGGFYGGVGNVVSTQKQRAAEYYNYTASIYHNPAIVGWEWYKYMDDPLTGRDLPSPQENMNSGFVDITDSPYSDLVQTAADVNRGIYRRIDNTDKCAANTFSVYRLKNKATKIHLFTTDFNEFTTLVKTGFVAENYGISDAVFAVEKYALNDAQPLLRLYNPVNGQHYLTLNSAEHDILVRLGWKDEGKAGYAYLDSAPDRKEIFHLYKGNDHLYTVRTGERDALIQLGWKLQNKDAQGNGAFGFVSASCN